MANDFKLLKTAIEKTLRYGPVETDRMMRLRLILGWPVMRFTGAELMRDPNACAADVAAYLCGGAS